MAKRGVNLSQERIDAFFEVFVETGKVTEGARAAGFSTRSAYNLKNKSPELKERWEEANQQVDDMLDAEIWRRGHDGIDKPIFYQGRVVATIKEYSDKMLELAAIGRMPHKYARRAVEMTGKDGKDLIPQMDDIEAARRMAWLLTQGAAAKKKQDASPPITLAPMPDKENESGRSE